MTSGNLFTNAAPPPEGERFTILHQSVGLTIERIVSSRAPASGEYDQPHDEWVLLLGGEAELEVAGERRSLVAGDYVHLPAHTKHRVLRTSEGALWLAVHQPK